MNFYGHAVVSGWMSASAPRALGAMLPDFASMCRGRVHSVEHDEVAAGVSLHHVTDRAFHALAVFRTMTRRTDLYLRDLGVNRGGARATAHVAIELLLDGVLVERGAAAELYLSAIDAAPEVAESIEWRADDHRARWHDLIERLAERGVPRGYADADTVCDRVTLVLSRRPLLALDDADEVIVREQMPRLQREVAERADEIMSSLRAQLE